MAPTFELANPDSMSVAASSFQRDLAHALPFAPPFANRNGFGYQGDDGSSYDGGNGNSFPPPASYSSLASVQQGFSQITISPSTSLTSSSTSTVTAVLTTINSEPPQYISTVSSTSMTTTSSHSATSSGTVAQPVNETSSIPQNKAYPDLESKAHRSALGIAGTVLAAIFGFIGLVTTLYLLSRVIRRQREKRFEGRWLGDHQRSNTVDSVAGFEKTSPVAWSATAQETGIVFNQRLHSRGDDTLRPQQEGRVRSTLFPWNRRSNSSGSQINAAQERTPAPSTPRWGAPLSGLGLFHSRWSPTTVSTDTRERTPALSTPRWGAPFSGSGLFHSRWSPSTVTTDTLDNDHRSRISNLSEQTPNSRDQPSSALQRSVSQSTARGAGYARAYAHHDVRAPSFIHSPRPVTADRRLQRRSDSNRSVSETSEAYHGSRYRTSLRSTSAREGRRASRESAQMPRLPLPVAISTDSHRLSL